MEEKRIEEMYKTFKKKYKDGEINILFFEDGYSTKIEKGSISKENQNEFRQFCDEFINCLSEYAIREVCGPEYKKCVIDFLDENKMLKEDIFIKIQSNLKTLVDIKHEILTKRSESLQINAFSALCCIKYKVPSGPSMKFEQLTLELTSKDLEELKESIVNIENKIKNIVD